MVDPTVVDHLAETSTMCCVSRFVYIRLFFKKNILIIPSVERKGITPTIVGIVTCPATVAV